MRNVLLAILIILLIPVYLIAYISIHEIGHTTMARFLGDPNAVYYLIKMDKYSQAIGLTDYDISKLSWGANLITTVGGVMATQLVALTALLLLRLRQFSHRVLGRWLGIVAFTFAFDPPFQMIQALAYKGLERWPSGVDFMDVVLLLQMKFEVSSLVLNGLLLLLTVLYIAGLVWIYERAKIRRRLWQPSPGAA
jgi:hypothetical protein